METKMIVKMTPKREFSIDCGWISEWMYYDLEFIRTLKDSKPFKLIATLSNETGITIGIEHEYDRIWQTYLLGFLAALDMDYHSFEKTIEDALRENYEPKDLQNASLLVKVYDGHCEIEKMED